MKILKRLSNKIKYGLCMAMLFCLFLGGCKKFIEVDPPVTNITEESAYATDATATAVVTGLYVKLSGAQFQTPSFSNISGLIAGLSADELTLWSGVSNENLIAYYTNKLSAISNTGYDVWIDSYKYIFTCNAAIEGLTKSTTLTLEVQQQLLGEVNFLRAFFYFYLVNLYGDVPLVLTTDYRTNAIISRSPKNLVYQQIIADLQAAKNLLSNSFLDRTLVKTTTERLRPTKWAASALLARVFLFNQEWSNAESESSLVITNTTSFGLSTLANAFNKNNKEAIWQLQPVNAGWNTEHARLFIIPVSGPGGVNPVYLNRVLLNSFEPNDNRKTNWISYVKVGADTFYFPYKYKALDIPATSSASEYLSVLRIGEQFLIRSEARAQQGNIAGAQSDLNAIRTRAGLGITSANDKASLSTAILQERRVELFTEWGNRWLDLKRTNNIDAVMATATAQKGSTWNTNQQLYPLPYSEIQSNRSLVQNAGY